MNVIVLNVNYQDVVHKCDNVKFVNKIFVKIVENQKNKF